MLPFESSALKETKNECNGLDSSTFNPQLGYAGIMGAPQAGEKLDPIQRAAAACDAGFRRFQSDLTGGGDRHENPLIKSWHKGPDGDLVHGQAGETPASPKNEAGLKHLDFTQHPDPVAAAEHSAAAMAGARGGHHGYSEAAKAHADNVVFGNKQHSAQRKAG
jgi:hypothetical protein